MTNSKKIIVSPEHKKKLDDLESLKSELAKLISERDTLENTVKKNLEALYAIKIGKNEFTLFKTECETARFKRKIELFQAKINHGEKFNVLEIDNHLDKEYKKWEKEISDMLEDIENSKKRLSSLMTKEDSIELQAHIDCSLRSYILMLIQIKQKNLYYYGTEQCRPTH
ncbi:MAG: hypothetical protein H8E13_17730 [Actinobacteria bacterium]|nr:hypothetical protein [Actinomycetota bacterium]